MTFSVLNVRENIHFLSHLPTALMSIRNSWTVPFSSIAYLNWRKMFLSNEHNLDTSNTFLYWVLIGWNEKFQLWLFFEYVRLKMSKKLILYEFYEWWRQVASWAWKVATSLHYVPSKATIEVFPSRLDTLGTEFSVRLQHSIEHQNHLELRMKMRTS